ncbi:phosphatase PAP2 family protein [Amycolatopsis sp. cg5]|uniref:hypothetical protein n=1 Tax=Amycolatopsis sp. cg5 TaxID=3238802 RepID=UPI0035233BCE
MLGLPLAVAWMATGRVGPTLLWGLLVAVTGSLIPMAVIVRGARKGNSDAPQRWDGHHVTNRAGRAVPLLVAGISLGAGFVVLVVWHAPDEIIALAASMLASLVVSVAITFGFKFKISLHAAVAVSALVVLIITYGPWAWVLLPLVVWVCWSRVELGDHTPAEVLSGAVMGLVVGGLGFWAILAAIRG